MELSKKEDSPTVKSIKSEVLPHRGFEQDGSITANGVVTYDESQVISGYHQIPH